MDQKRNSNLLEDEITVMLEEIEARQRVLFSGLGWVAKQTQPDYS